ncbi:sugar porter family MFS transporter [Nocardiopsis salina]|uniref:sugar porter family MFS transporter n=1 Tax=Nocardiopsis salina TaxID=245836 RepID=UPI00034BFF8C|nr:sugar porter family MFS transporter [Nocardiopsis salina]
MSFIHDIRNSSRLVVVVALSAVALGITYGYDISNIAGALLFLEPDLGLSSGELAGLATAVVVGQIVGALNGGWISNAIGRKLSMQLIAVGYVAFSVLCAVAPEYWSLLAARFGLGITIGISLIVVPVFIAESSPSRVRGGLTVAYQVTTVAGIIAGYLVAWGLASTESWRAILGLAAVPAALVFFLLLRVVETPHWYLMKGRAGAARASLEHVDPGRDPEPLITRIQSDLEQETGRLRDMFRGHLLRASVFAIGLGFFIQITGINATIYYSPHIFEDLGFSGYAALLGLPAIVQFCALLAVIVSMFIVDNAGRRPVLLTGVGTMILANAVLVAVFALSDGLGGWTSVVGFAAIVLFTMGYTFGFGALVWVYAGETFPAKYRALGASLMLTANLTANAIVAQAFPPLLDSVGGAGVFGIFGVLAAIAFVFIWYLAPETKDRDLDEIARYWANGARWDTPSTRTERTGR